jgi:hypothetical protein
VYQCEQDAKSLKAFCNLYGEGGRSFSTPSSEPSDARLLYNMYILNSSALNGYFYTSVQGYIQLKPDSPELVAVQRDFQTAFWAEPNFKAFPSNTKLSWTPID